jgi:hypothetical protein
MERYSVHQTGEYGDHYVYDNLRGQFVQAYQSYLHATSLANSLNQRHEESPSPAGVPEDVVRRVRAHIALCEQMAAEGAALLPGYWEANDLESAAYIEDAVRDRWGLASDLRVLFAALGMPQEV